MKPFNSFGGLKTGLFGTGLAMAGVSGLSALAIRGTKKINEMGVSAPPPIYPGSGNSTGQRLQTEPSPTQGLRFSFKR